MDSSRFVDSGKYVGDAQGCHITGYQRRDCFGASANEEGDKHDAAAGSLLAAISAASRVPGLFAPSQFRWERPEREPSRGWKDDQQTADEMLSEEWVKVMPPISSGP